MKDIRVAIWCLWMQDGGLRQLGTCCYDGRHLHVTRRTDTLQPGSRQQEQYVLHVTATVLYCTIQTSDSHWISIWTSRSSYVTCISDIFKLNSQLTRAHFQIELICNLVTGVLYTVCVAPLLKYQYKWLDWGTSDPWHSPSGTCGTFHNSLHFGESNLFHSHSHRIAALINKELWFVICIQ